MSSNTATAPATETENPIVRLDTCCGYAPHAEPALYTTFLINFECFSGFLILVIGIYVLFGVLLAEQEMLMLGGAFTIFSLFLVLLLSCAEFGFALYAFTDIRKAEPLGIRFLQKHPICLISFADICDDRYYYMFKLVSLGFSLLVFFLTTTWTTPEIFNLLISMLFSLYCIWCIWSLHEALMLGGEAAAKAGFTLDEAGENSPLLSEKKGAVDKPSAQYV